jgi:hypothetical protein
MSPGGRFAAAKVSSGTWIPTTKPVDLHHCLFIMTLGLKGSVMKIRATLAPNVSNQPASVETMIRSETVLLVRPEAGEAEDAVMNYLHVIVEEPREENRAMTIAHVGALCLLGEIHP